MVKVEEILEYRVLCPSCDEGNMILEILHYDDGSALVTESCPCGHYDERFLRV